MKKLTQICILLIISTLGVCQSPFRLSFNHLTREDGLSNNNVFYIYRDSRGFVWLGTMNGLNRFDGINVKVYKPYNSDIKGTKITNIVEDKAGNLWIGSESGLNFYDRKKDAFIDIKFPKNYPSASAFPHTIDSNNLLWLVITSAKISKLYTYNPKTQTYVFKTDEVSEQICNEQNRGFKAISTIYCGGWHDEGLRKLTFRGDNIMKVDSFFCGNNKQPILKNIKEYFFVENDSTVWIGGTQYGLFKFNPNKGTYKVFDKLDNTKVEYLTQITQFKQYLFIGSNNGLYIFDKIQEKFVQLIQHSPTQANSPTLNWNECIYKDYDDNIFLGFGVDFTNLNRNIAEQWLSKSEINKLGHPDNHISSFVQNGDFIFAKSQAGGVLVLDKFGKYIRRFEGFTPIFTDSQRRTWLSNERFFLLYNPYSNKSKKLTINELGDRIGWEANCREISKNKYFISTLKGIFEYDENTRKLTAIDDFNKIFARPIYPMYYDSTSQQLFVSANWWTEFYIINRENNKWHLKKKMNVKFGIFAFRASLNPQKLWLCTNQGLGLLDLKTLDYKLVTEKEGLPDNAVTDILEEANGNYWLVTNRGISYYNKSKNEYRNFKAKDGAYSSEYGWGSAVRFSDGRLAFAGTDGITVFNPKVNFSYNTQPKIQITQLLANEQPLRTAEYIGETSVIELQPNQNTFALDLIGIELGFPQNLKIHYQLEGYDKQWIKAKNPATARYVNVSEGTYKFLVKAIDEDDRVSSQIRELTIIVHAPFYRTIWFRVLLVLCLIGLGYLLYRLRINQIREEARKKEEIKRIRAEAEINALRSQMNPHFIFNCLNTIDSYILLNKTDEASDFLNKFSKLIRRILENSRQEFIPLEQEIQTLELYIKLEQERSFPKFLYEISLDNKLYDSEYYVPTMLIQPFVENAILHGIRHKRDEIGELYLNIKVVDNQMIIHIIDNGIGREASSKINSLKNFTKNSVGIKLTEERIQKINELYTNRAYVKVTDIDEGNDKGTIVEIGLPLLQHEDIFLHN